MFAIETVGLTKHYGDVQALAGVDLRVPAGSIFGFLGPNGAGKTTAMRILVGLLRASGGQATVLGRDVWRESTAIRRDVGYLPGDVRLYEWMTGRRFAAWCDAMRGDGGWGEIDRLARRLDLNLDRRIRNYSRGMKQKLGLIASLAHRPKLLILDEPTTALDPLVQQTLYDELRSAASKGRTVLFSSHTLSEVELLCDRVAIIRAGRIIADSSIADLRARAVRRVELRMTDDELRKAVFPKDWIDGSSRDGAVLGSWRGPVDGLLAWLGSLKLQDVAIGAPDLEDLFAAYYREDTPAPGKEARS
ncbi:MAG TPA: ABC transporter ATP-binding protein [Phycisphaerae bacterium]|nr:ABC transporter ATP-binding protein [Phycisphaerae bacterium]